MAGKNLGGKAHHRDSADNDESDADPQVDALVFDEARGDALVDHVALLEEQLPGRDGGADDSDDEQHDVGQRRFLRQMRHGDVVDHLADRRMHHDDHRHKQQAAEHQKDREPFKAPEIAGTYGGHHQKRRGQHADAFRQAQIVQGQADADELGDDGQRIEQKKIDNAEGAQNLQKRSRISRAWPMPDTAPSRKTIS